MNELAVGNVDPQLYRVLIESVKDYAIILVDPNGRVVTWTEGARLIKGYEANEIIGQFISKFYPPEVAQRGFPEHELKQAAEKGRFEDENWRVRKDGSRFWANVVLTALHDQSGKLIGFGKMTRDLTERKQAEEKIRRQSQEILELSTPVVQMWEGVVVTPLIGTLDSNRTQQFMERLLHKIVETNSPVAIVDITGVPTIDTQTAQHLMEAINAVRLLGAQVVLTGVRPAIAQTLVHLGVELPNVTTRSSLAGGFRVALESLSLQVLARNGQA